MSKKLYTAFSFWDFTWSLILRLACVFAIIYFITVYNENPAVILFLLIVCSHLFFTMGDDKIVVYTDKIIQTDNSFLSFFFKSNDITYFIKDIKSAYTSQKPASRKAETGVAVIIKLLIPKRRSQLPSNSYFFIDLKNGETKKVETSLGESKIAELLKDINLLVKRNGIP